MAEAARRNENGETCHFSKRKNRPAGRAESAYFSTLMSLVVLSTTVIPLSDPGLVISRGQFSMLANWPLLSGSCSAGLGQHPCNNRAQSVARYMNSRWPPRYDISSTGRASPTAIASCTRVIHRHREGWPFDNNCVETKRAPMTNDPSRHMSRKASAARRRDCVTFFMLVPLHPASVEMSQHVFFSKGHEVVKVDALGGKSFPSMWRNKTIVHLWRNR